MKNKLIFAVILISCLAPCFKSASATEYEDYMMVKEAVKSHDKEFAFMYYQSILENYPQSKHREDALFASAEYYFNLSAYRDAATSFNEFLSLYPDSKLKPFALFYLLKIAQSWKEEDLAKDIQNQIINLERIVLLFKEAKEYKLKSPLGEDYRLARYIDKLEFYSDGKLLAQISY